MSSHNSLSSFTDEEKRKILDKIIAFFLDQRDEEIGVVAANDILEFIESDILPTVYNKAVEDVNAVLKEHLDELDFKLGELKKTET